MVSPNKEYTGLPESLIVKKGATQACRPDSVRRQAGVAIIPLGRQLPAGSSHLPARSDGPPFGPIGPLACLFDVAPGGVWRAGPVARPAVSSYLTVSPLPASGLPRWLWRFALCSTFRRRTVFQHCNAWPLASTLSCGVRTFLQPAHRSMPASDRPAWFAHAWYPNTTESC